MQIKVDNQYLDFNEPIEVERQVKLFEQVSEASGDFSYSFTVIATKKNRSIFNLYSINQSDKTIYQRIPAVLEDNGVLVYSGYIKVESDNENEIECSFFSGNTNWMTDLDFNLRDFDFSQHDRDWDITTITNLETATTGVIFPVIDTGALETRSHVNWHVDDFHPFIFVKSAIQTLLNRNGIKLEGDILQDWRYNHLITSNARASAPQDEINDRSVFVNKTSVQNITADDQVVTFGNTTGDYYAGTLWNTITNRLVADKDIVIDVSLTVDATPTSGPDGFVASLIINGTTTIFQRNGQKGSLSFENGNETKSLSIKNLKLQSGEFLDVRGFLDDPGAPADVNSATITINPTRIYGAFSSYLLPDVKAKDFVSGVFSLFNTVIDYNANTKVLNVDLFNNVIRRPELDISRYIKPSSIENNYTELMESYGANNVFLYSEAETDIVANYNNGSVYPFGSGVIESDNTVNGAEVNVIESEFIAAMEDSKNPFKTFLPKLSWRSLSETDLSDEGASATNPGAGLTFTASGYAVGDLVRISDSTVEEYNGDWIVSSATSTTFRVMGLTYTSNATVDIVKLSIDFEDKDEQALLLALPNISLNDFTNNTLLFLAESGSTSSTGSPATAYFYKPLQGLDVDDYKESLSFGDVNIPNAYQITMLESYWRDFENVLRDPVKLLAQAHFPKAVFDSLFDRPLRIKTSRFNSLFFMSRVTGYNSSYLPCDIEPIKIK